MHCDQFLYSTNPTYIRINVKLGGTNVPRAVLPRIQLQSPKITRNLTTDWFANRVDERYRKCLGR